MRSFTVIHVGDFKEEYFACAEAEYIRRIKHNRQRSCIAFSINA